MIGERVIVGEHFVINRKSKRFVGTRNKVLKKYASRVGQKPVFLILHSGNIHHPFSQMLVLG